MRPGLDVIESVIKPFTDRHQRLPLTHVVGGLFDVPKG